mmetsp:Transcript_67860/g.201989  ORF Transcript_67860/g.201989 Transcript_67860/m.201989 type:complete len:135 (+) Transcript_67860:112-516(+)
MALPKLSMKKARKPKRVPKIARGRSARALVFSGRREKTVGGVRREGLMRNTRGRIVSKRRNALGKRAFRNVEGWVQAIMEARVALHSKGFVAINGKTLHGKALYLKAKSIRAQQRQASPAASSTEPAPPPSASA